MLLVVPAVVETGSPAGPKIWTEVENNNTLSKELPFDDANFWGIKFRADLRKHHNSIKSIETR